MSVDGGGLRFNSGKLSLSYCPLSTQIAVAAVFSANSQMNGGKYPDNNWRRGQPWSIPLDSAKRHLEAFISGEIFDPHSKLPHLWHVQANIAMLIEFSVTYPKGDDRLTVQNINVAGFEHLLSQYEVALEENKKRSQK